MIWRKRKNCLALLVGMQTGEATLGNSMQILKKVKIDYIIQQLHYWVPTQTIQKHYFKMMHAPQCLHHILLLSWLVLLLLFITAKIWKLSIWSPTSSKNVVVYVGTHGWLSRLHIWLCLRSWFRNLWVQALHQALCWQLRGWSPLQILSPSLSAPPQLVFSLSKINIKKLKELDWIELNWINFLKNLTIKFKKNLKN